MRPGHVSVADLVVGVIKAGSLKFQSQEIG